MTDHPDRGDLSDEVAVLLTETTYPLVEAARLAGVRVHYCALVRSALSGRLASIKIAGKRLTSVRAIREWIAAANQPRESLPPPPRRRGRRVRPTTTDAERRVLESRGLPSRSRSTAK